MVYYEKNKEKMKASAKQWQKNNPEKKKISNKKWADNNPEKIKEYNKKRQLKKNPNYKPRVKLSLEEKKKKKRKRLEWIRQYNKKRRLKLRIQVFNRDNYTCKICGRKPPEVELQIDHIHPKSKEGLNNINNYQTLCKDCNIGKGDMILQEF